MLSPEFEDDLTGLPNRRWLLRQLTAPAAGRLDGLTLLGLDGFDEALARHGRAKADKALQEAAKRLSAAAPVPAAAGRYGGSTFFVARAPGAAERFVASLATPLHEGFAIRPSVRPWQPPPTLSVAALPDALATFRPGVFVLTGGPASATLRALSLRSRDIGAAAVLGSASPSRRECAADTMLQLLDRICARRPAFESALRTRLKSPFRAGVREFVPGFEMWDEDDSDASAFDPRLLAMQSAEAALRLLAESAPLLLLVDHAENLDEGSAEVLRALFREEAPPICCVLGGGAFEGAVSVPLPPAPPVPAPTLDGDRLALVQHAAVIGPRFMAADVQDLMGAREAETLELLDRASEVVRPVGIDALDELEYEFVGWRDVFYAGAPLERAHKRLSDLTRFRHAHKPSLGAPEASWHLAHARGGRSGRADTSIRSRSLRTVAPMSADARRLAEQLVDGLVALIRLRRLYPQWPDAGTRLRVSLGETVRELLVNSPVVALAPDERGLLVNGTALATDPGQELSRTLERRLVASLTLRIGLDARELLALVPEFAARMDAAAAPADLWDRILRREDTKHVEIVQARGLGLRQGDTARRVYADSGRERLLEPVVEEKLRVALEAVRAASGLLRMYAPDHATVEQALKTVAPALAEALGPARAISLGCPEGKLLANGVELALRPGPDAAGFVAGEMQRKDIRSITLREGLSELEARAFVSILAVEDPRVVRPIVADNDLHRVAVVMRSARHTTTRRVAAMLQPAVRLPEAGRIRMRADTRARIWLASPSEVFLSETGQVELAPLLCALGAGTYAPLGVRLLDRVGASLMDSRADVRRGAAVAMARVLEELPDDQKGAALTKLRKPLVVALSSESDARVIRVLPEAARAWLSAAIAGAPISVAGDFIAAVMRPEMHRELRLGILARVRTIGHALAPALERLRQGPDLLRKAAIRILGLLGPRVAPALVEFVRATDEPDARRAAADALRELGAGGDLMKLVAPDTSSDSLVRVYDVLDRVGAEGLVGAVLAGLEHADDRVRSAATSLVRRADRGTAAAVIKKLLTRDAAHAVGLARELKIGEAGPDVLAAVRGTDDDDLAREACDYFHASPLIAAGSFLRYVYERRGRMLGLVRGFSDETRAAAVAAAARLEAPDARAMVASAKSDSSAVVRARAGFGA